MAKPVGAPGETRDRVRTAAIELFTEHGVGGTSLQMIANRLGVTKAAVYFQFPAKDDIVLAVVQPAIDQLAEVLDAAEAEPDPQRRRDLVVEGLIDVVLDNREVMAALHGDPGVTEVVRAHPQLQAPIDRVARALMGPEPGLSSLVAGSLFGGGLMLIGSDPRLRDVDRAQLLAELQAAARRIL